MKINVHIREWMTTVHCGMGNQSMRWLADVAVYKHDQNYNQCSGTATGFKFDNGVEVNFNASNISEELTDDVHLYLQFKEDNYDMLNSARKGGKAKAK